MDKSDVEKLLNHVSEINAKYDLEAQETGNRFNIFDIMNVSHKEVYMCRVLSELLNPMGCHSQGNLYLKLFFKILKKNHCMKFNFVTPSMATVLREEGIDDCRRIDITIDDSEHKQYLPIEVKIYANDQKNQCEDYLKKAREKYGQNGNARLCYLTIDGKMPDKSSIGDLSNKEREQIITISWEKDIIEWLNSCICHTDTIRKTPILEVLLQFKSAIEYFTNLKEDKRMEDLLELLRTNEKYWQVALEIANNINDIKEELWEKRIKAPIEHKIGIKSFISDDCRLAYTIREDNDETLCAVLYRDKKKGLLLSTAKYNSCKEYIKNSLKEEQQLGKVLDKCDKKYNFDDIVNEAVIYIKSKCNYVTK